VTVVSEVCGARVGHSEWEAVASGDCPVVSVGWAVRVVRMVSREVALEVGLVSGGVFINYRGADSRSYGAMLYAELARRFGPERVFLDAESIPAGSDYVEQLLGRVRRARVLLAVIGGRWLATDSGGRRGIDDPADWIRRELVAAFDAGVRVVPVLTDGARMPAEGELPADLAPLVRCQFRRLRHRDATADVGRLVADLAGLDPDLGLALQRGPYGLPEIECPYPGMVSFGREDARFFHGRDRVVATLLSRMRTHIRGGGGGGPLVVVGPSGVGKSSLVRAGLLPALSAGDVPIDGSACWPQVYLRPGADPLAELATHVRALGAREADLPAALRAAPDALRSVLGEVVGVCGSDRAADSAGAAPRRERRVVVVVDQIEELFTHDACDQDRLAMLRALIRASQPSGTDPAPAVVLLGLRADFYAHFARVSELAPFLQDNQILVTAMTDTERRQAIVGPAATVGLRVEPGLVEVLIAEGSGDALPQLAHVLRRAFTHRTGQTLTVEGYRAAGGIGRAVATTADAVHDALNQHDRKLLRRLVLAMVAVVDGAEDTRRRVPRDQLLDSDPTHRHDAERILAQLIDDRLVTAEDNSYMLSHDALIRAWPKLRTWLSEDRDGLRLHRDLSDRAHAWHRHNRDPNSLYGGTELDLARRWVDNHPDDLHGIERDFYQASLAAEQARHAAEQAQQRTRRRQLRIVSALLIIATTAGLLAWVQRGQAVQQRHLADATARTAIARQLAAQSTNLINTDPDLASLLAVESYQTDPTDEGRAALAAAANLPLRHRLVGHTGPVDSVAFSPDGRMLACPGGGRRVRLVVMPPPGVAVFGAGGSFVVGLVDGGLEVV
jgi:hypothetical protein